MRETPAGYLREAQVLAWLAEAELGRGEIERASALAREAIASAQARPPQFEIDVWLAHARIQLRASGAGARADVEEALARAEALIRRTQAAALAPPLQLARAELARSLGDASGAQRHLREAQRLYAEMGAAGHAERLSRELAALEDAT
jgi:hypothetical protein